jgi:hypothetical protein
VPVNVDAIVKQAEKKGRLNYQDLERFVNQCIPESCEKCIWIKGSKKSICNSPKEAPCRIYLYRLLNNLERRGLI